VRDTHTAVLLQPAGLAFRVDQFRAYIKQFIDSQRLKYGGLLNALSVGVRTGIRDTQWQVFRNTGTAHLIAISGLHIGMVAGIAYFLGNLLWRHTMLVRTHYPAQRVALIMEILAAIIYAALAGFSLPALRALLMLVVYFSLQLLRRNPGDLFSLGFVLLVVLLSGPLAPLGAGFWLSFAVVTAIALATRKKHASFRDENGNRVPTAFKQKFKRRFSQ
jgi:competence protein ComEC